MAVGILAILLSDQNKSNANANATINFKASDTVVQDLKTVLLNVKEETEYRICAAEILEHLHRTKGGLLSQETDGSHAKCATEGMSCDR